MCSGFHPFQRLWAFFGAEDGLLPFVELGGCGAPCFRGSGSLPEADPDQGGAFSGGVRPFEALGETGFGGEGVSRIWEGLGRGLGIRGLGGASFWSKTSGSKFGDLINRGSWFTTYRFLPELFFLNNISDRGLEFNKSVGSPRKQRCVPLVLMRKTSRDMTRRSKFARFGVTRIANPTREV